MNRNEIWSIAMRQSAIDLGCAPEDFLKDKNQIVISSAHPEARKYLELPFYCELVSYGSNIVASVSPEAENAVRDYLDRFSIEHCFETPGLYILNDAFAQNKMKICFMAEYFLPDPEFLRPQSCGYEIRVLEPEDFQEYYTDSWGNALTPAHRDRDVLAAAAYDRGKLIALAGCSSDCGTP